MKLNAPTKVVFLISVIAGLVGIILKFVVAGSLGFFILAAAFVLLALACVLKGL